MPGFPQTPLPVVRLQTWPTLEWPGALLVWARSLGLKVETLGRAEMGKPHFCEAPDWHFNVSTTRGQTVAALARFEVGIDWEWLGREVSALRIARRYFFPDEIAWMEAGPVGEVNARFHQLWTAKEAGVKLDGRGIYHGGLCALRVDISDEGKGGRGWLEERPLVFRRVLWEGDLLITVAAFSDFRLALPGESPKVGEV